MDKERNIDQTIRIVEFRVQSLHRDVPNFCAHTDRAVSMWPKNCWLDCHALAGGAVIALLNTVRKLLTAGPGGVGRSGREGRKG